MEMLTIEEFTSCCEQLVGFGEDKELLDYYVSIYNTLSEERKLEMSESMKEELLSLQTIKKAEDTLARGEEVDQDTAHLINAMVENIEGDVDPEELLEDIQNDADEEQLDAVKEDLGL